MFSFESCNCQVMIGFKGAENCIKTYLDESGSQDLLQICIHLPNSLKAQVSTLIFAKKMAIDCSRFKDK